MKWAFSDESRRPGWMFVGVVVLETHEIVAARQVMRQLLLPGQRRVHLTDERQRRRNEILAVALELPAQVLVFRARTPGRQIVRVRRALLVACLETLLAERVERWTLDGVEAVQRDRDRADIGEHLRARSLVLQYDHEPSFAEPLLWAADAVTWAAGAGPRGGTRFASRVAITDVEP